MKCSQVFLPVYVWFIFAKSGETDAMLCPRLQVTQIITGDELSANIANYHLLCLQHRRYKQVDQSDTVMIKA